MGYPYAAQGCSRKAGIRYSQSERNRGRCPSSKRHWGRNSWEGNIFLRRKSMVRLGQDMSIRVRMDMDRSVVAE